LNWNEYVKKAITTMAFRNDEVATTCTLLGMCGELAEYQHKLKYGIGSGNYHTELLKELGDVYWYIAVFSNLMHLDLEGYKYDVLKNVDPFMSIGLLQEAMKKGYRERSYHQIDATFLELVRYLLMDVRIYVEQQVLEQGSTITTVWQMNIDKLADRKERGVLHSAGDNR